MGGMKLMSNEAKKVRYWSKILKKLVCHVTVSKLCKPGFFQFMWSYLSFIKIIFLETNMEQSKKSLEEVRQTKRLLHQSE